MEISSTNRSARATQVQTRLAEKQKPQDKKVESGATEPNAKREAPQPTINSQGQRIGQVINTTA